jgi:hypothetical protein
MGTARTQELPLMADMVPQGTQLEGVPHGHESADANIRSVTMSVIILLSSTVVVMVAMVGMFNYLNNREERKDVRTPATFQVRQLPPGPPLLPSPKRDELPWAAYQNERPRPGTAGRDLRHRQQADRRLPRCRTSPGQQLAPQDLAKETEQYFKSKPQWEQKTNRYTQDSTGGHELKARWRALATAGI